MGRNKIKSAHKQNRYACQGALARKRRPRRARCWERVGVGPFPPLLCSHVAGGFRAPEAARRMGNTQKSSKWEKKSLSDGLPGPGGREEKTTTRDSLGQGSDQEVQPSGDGMTAGKAGFSIPMSWMRKLRLRSLESEFESLLEDTDTGAGCHVEWGFSTEAFWTLGRRILYDRGLSCALVGG